MDQENNFRRRKSEDGYSDANRSDNGNRNYRENDDRSNNFNRDNRNDNDRYRGNNNGGNYERRPYNNDERPNNNYRDGNRTYNSGNAERRPYGDRPYNSGNSERRPYSGDRPYNNGGNYEQRPSRPRYNNDNNSEYKPRTYNQPRQGYNNYNQGSSSSSEEAGERRKRPRIGERLSPGSDKRGNNYGERSNNNYGERSNNNYGERNNSYGNRGNSYGNRQSSYGGGYGNQRRSNFGGGNRPYDPNAKYSQKKQLEYKETLTDPNTPLRLNKYLANAGVCSRREADEYIQAGAVKVNGEVVTELGKKVIRADKVMFHDQLVSLEKKAYILLNKPKNCVTTSDDPQERITVMDLIKGACNERIYPVGRLDRNTTGVLLLTNDGELASKLTHPKFVKKKIYHVVLDKPLTKADMQQIADGIELEDGKVHADAISYAKEEDKREIGIEIHIGKNRIVRRIFDHLDYKVIKLDRVYFAGLTKKNVTRGKWRYLTQKEVDMLKMGAFE